MIIISVVTSITLPAINNFHSSDRCKAEASILVSYIRQAKYQAMQDNCIIRLIFDVEDGFANRFKIQKYEPVSETIFDTELKINTVLRSSAHNDYSFDGDTNGTWESIADTEEIDFNSSTEVELKDWDPLYSYSIYFRPDGYLYIHLKDAPAPNVYNPELLSEKRIIFKYGNSAIAVDINALGVISSEAIALDEDEDYFDDKYNPDNDTDTHYNTGTEID